MKASCSELLEVAPSGTPEMGVPGGGTMHVRRVRTCNSEQLSYFHIWSRCRVYHVK